MGPRPPSKPLRGLRSGAASAPRAGGYHSSTPSRAARVREDLKKARSDLVGFVEALVNSSAKLRADVLLDDAGEPTALYQAIINAGQDAVNAMFRGENWEGADKKELTDVLNALPDALRDEIPNKQALLANTSRQARAVGR